MNIFKLIEKIKEVNKYQIKSKYVRNIINNIILCSKNCPYSKIT